MERKYADIIIDISHEKLDKTFQYVIPERLWETVEIGSCVSVPFGRGNRLRKGYVASIGEQASYEPGRLKEIADVEKNSIGAEERYIALAAWMKEQYGSTLIAALKTVLPIKQKVRKLERKSCKLLLDAEEAKQLLQSCEKKKQTAKARLLKELIQAGTAYAMDYRQAPYILPDNKKPGETGSGGDSFGKQLSESRKNRK